MPLIAKKQDAPKPQQDRVNSVAAGYMELEGAKKDGECAIVEVKNGISKDLGCCNLVDPTPHAQKFTCGLCTFVRPLVGYNER